MVPESCPLNDLDLAIRNTQPRLFVEIRPCLFLLRAHYRTNPGIDSHRWRVARIMKLKKKTGVKHEFIVACLRCNGVENDQYLQLERMSEIGSGPSPGFYISVASDRAWIFSEEDPANDPENKELMSLVPSPLAQMTLPELLIFADSIHHISPVYEPFGANCYWFADAMVNAMQHHGFAINWEKEQSQKFWAKRWMKWLKSFTFHKSTATVQQMNDIYNRFTNTRTRFFDFQQPLF
ncbi:hypothetical protein M378DRAFT_177784 [Amanita muscaria Koide BX008]|uniref:Uncharacterized protein n=1 Tax=Amanita muscaria (strain Koide BX008) TaxID=946122 RepID=A0A0C2THE7_AMAMK|nr:hypothetical protein M378DRAFT_177784 [Amanita muscaria Koide BX008]